VFWNLLLAHFLADFPLQSSRMAANKGRLPVLALHAGTHLAVMLLVLTPAWRELWPYCLLIAVVHFFIDYGKITLSARLPGRGRLLYLLDQLLHYATLIVVAIWVNRTQGSLALALDPGLAIVATGYLLATYVWAISEKVLTDPQSPYQQELASGFWPRMAARALLLTGLLWLLYPGRSAGLWIAQGIALPYVSGNHARRALLTDLLVGAGAWLFILAAGWQAAALF
jgi:hypothetical protein